LNAVVTESRDASLLAGRVGRPHGLDGSFYVTLPRPSLLHDGVEVTLEPSGRRTLIVRRAGTDAHPIVRVELASDRDAAEALRGSELRVRADAAPPLEPDEYWAEQLVGCRVHDAGTELGAVTALLTLPSCDCLQVERAGSSALLVPMVRDAIRSIDVQARVIEIDLEFLGGQP
jgi:16S rRNA processing protein RimM